MPDPTWSFEYDFSKTPEQNLLFRTEYSDPALTLFTHGGNKRLEINSDSGDMIFTTAFQPTFHEPMTVEILMSVNGAGDGGFEATMAGKAFAIAVTEDDVSVTLPADISPYTNTIPTSSNTTDILWRATYDGSDFRLYRNTSLVEGPESCPNYTYPVQRFLFWGESGGTVVFKKISYSIGTAISP